MEISPITHIFYAMKELDKDIKAKTGAAISGSGNLTTRCSGTAGIRSIDSQTLGSGFTTFSAERRSNYHRGAHSFQ